MTRHDIDDLIILVIKKEEWFEYSVSRPSGRVFNYKTRGEDLTYAEKELLKEEFISNQFEEYGQVNPEKVYLIVK